MARGWESKAIEDQQQEAERRKDVSGPRESSATDRRRTLELAGAQTAGQLALARSPAQREALDARWLTSTTSCGPCREARRRRAGIVHDLTQPKIRGAVWFRTRSSRV